MTSMATATTPRMNPSAVDVVRGRSEQGEAREEELDDHPQQVDHGEAVEDHACLRHALDCTRPAGRARAIVRADGSGDEAASTASSSTGRSPSRRTARSGLAEPASGKPLAKAATAGTADVDRGHGGTRGARGRVGKTPPNERSRLLHALADAIVANRKELAELETRNVGKAVRLDEARGDRRGRELSATWPLRSDRSKAARPIGGSILSYTLKEPVGVAAQIVPWNYPIMLAGWKLAPALAAGCTAVLKPDPATPLTALRLAELAAEVGIPAGVVNVVPGDGPTTGAYLVSHPGVDKVAFTGSTATGSEIMRLAPTR